MDFPQKAIYKRRKDRMYFLGDFKDGEEIEFSHTTGRPSATAMGNAFYRSSNTKDYRVNLVNIKDLKPIQDN